MEVGSIELTQHVCKTVKGGWNGGLVGQQELEKGGDLFRRLLLASVAGTGQCGDELMQLFDTTVIRQRGHV